MKSWMFVEEKEDCDEMMGESGFEFVFAKIEPPHDVTGGNRSKLCKVNTSAAPGRRR